MHDAPPLSEYLRSSITEMYGQVYTRRLSPISQLSEGKHGVHSNFFFYFYKKSNIFGIK
jgi:hypothetical protein